MQFYRLRGFHPFVRLDDDLSARQNRRAFLPALDHPTDCLFPWDQTLDHKARPNLDPDKQYSANLWSPRIARVRVLQNQSPPPSLYSIKASSRGHRALGGG